MSPPVPSSFVHLWASIGAGFAGGAVLLADAGLGLLVLFGVPYAAAFAQSQVLRRHGRPVFRWTFHVGTGTILVALFFTALRLSSESAVRLLPAQVRGHAAFDPALYLISAALLGLAGAALIGAAVWGRRWPRTWMIWFAGRVAAGLLVGAAAYALGWTLEPDSPMTAVAGIAVLQGAADAAATAWLLWRYVLPHPDLRAAGSAP